MKNQKLKTGDKVQITKGPPDKVGRIGRITIIVSNGAIVKISKDRYTTVQFTHLKKVK